ncbi:MAG: ParB/RepB/Spo0J family partition protein [Candidatus Niyogibacteria bacterium]|nr:ParB/RepB/Spo0J family partition protein [Candidatus Niyogibacteria bacterium]
MTDGVQRNEQPAGSVFWVETDKIRPNPMQPRREFDEERLKELAESIRQYGILQPMVVVRIERDTSTGTAVDYELIAGERRLRAAKLAGLAHVPVLIRDEPADKVKLELALIENVQREDLNSIERARAFKQLMDEFNLKQREVGARVGKSREYVANTMRLLSLPDYIQKAIVDGRLTEGHTRPLLMLADRPQEQESLFNDIYFKRLTVRDAERAARRIAVERARRRDDLPDAETRSLEERLREALGTRVYIERKGIGGKISIEFFSEDELQNLIAHVASARAEAAHHHAEVVDEPPVAEGAPAPEEWSQELNPAGPAGAPMTAEAREDDLKGFTV